MVEVRTESTEDVEDLKVRVSALEERADYPPPIPYHGGSLIGLTSESTCRHRQSARLNVRPTSDDDCTSYEQCGDCGAHYGWHREHDKGPQRLRDERLLKVLQGLETITSGGSWRGCPVCSCRGDSGPQRHFDDDCELAACIALLEKEA